MLSKTSLGAIDRHTWSGHNHTEFCPHGSGEDVEAFIRQAILSGFKTYSITEHFPLPPAFYDRPVGSRHAVYTASFGLIELPAYLEKMARLKYKYRDQIRILIGFEVDFFPEYADWTAAQLAHYGDQIDDALLSVHFLPTKTGLRAIDDTAADFKDGVVAAYGSPLTVANAYLERVQAAVDWETPNKPARYGHIMLYRKWRNTFPAITAWEDATTRTLLTHILDTIADHGDQLDCNMAGLFRPTQTEFTPTLPWIQAAQQRQIPLVFGADAHSVTAVDQGYNTYLENHFDA
ncbi:histidinol-phosphatase HisJ [Levilactobacillus huananensis]|uniref:histidinol-phosphatase HisJ n=1 Tax=Levilactobacillus huananensis TaxID=2486019 RepID=UPI000F7B6A98|nr:histidinol-phosphatase HisJ [Levilactobacillus huananensis]